MPQRRIPYKPTTTVTCSDNGKSMTADVISFIPKQRLVVSIEKSIRMEMTYNRDNQLYISRRSGLEFASKGPEVFDLMRTK